jgi:hypothetical protein
MATTRDVIICECFSPEHQLIATYCEGENDQEYDDLFLEVHLSPRLGFFKRVIAAIKYIFGHKSIYGNWDCFSFDEENADKLIASLQKLKNNREARKNGNSKV